MENALCNGNGKDERRESNWYQITSSCIALENEWKNSISAKSDTKIANQFFFLL